jgi:hypothetical protein
MTIFRQTRQDIGQRFRRLLMGEKPDDALVWLWGAVPSFAVQSVGYPPAASYNDPEKSFWAQIWISEMFGDDGVPKIAVGGASDVTWAFGGEIKFFGERCIIAGNIEPAIIHLGTPDQIYTLCREALTKGIKAPRGYILMPGCGLPASVPPYSVFMLKKAAAEFGRDG